MSIFTILTVLILFPYNLKWLNKRWKDNCIPDFNLNLCAEKGKLEFSSSYNSITFWKLRYYFGYPLKVVNKRLEIVMNNNWENLKNKSWIYFTVWTLLLHHTFRTLWTTPNFEWIWSQWIPANLQQAGSWTFTFCCWNRVTVSVGKSALQQKGMWNQPSSYYLLYFFITWKRE